MDTNIAYGLMLATLGFFGYVGYQAATEKELEADEYLSARGTQSWLRIGLSLFASGMGIWILFGPSEVGYYGGFWDVVGYADFSINSLLATSIRWTQGASPTT